MNAIALLKATKHSLEKIRTQLHLPHEATNDQSVNIKITKVVNKIKEIEYEDSHNTMEH